MNRLEEAVEGLRQLLATPPRSPHPWRLLVHQRLAVVGEELTAEQHVAGDAWLTARSARLQRERERLMSRLTVLATVLEECTDLEPVRSGLSRLVTDVAHHRARTDELAYDDLALDVGGSD